MRQVRDNSGKLWTVQPILAIGVGARAAGDYLVQPDTEHIELVSEAGARLSGHLPAGRLEQMSAAELQDLVVSLAVRDGAAAGD